MNMLMVKVILTLFENGELALQQMVAQFLCCRESYHDKMCALGLIEESLANTSREMGLENSSRRKPFKIDFAKFQSNLQKLNTSPELEKYQESLQCIFSQTKGLLERAHEWDMENMSYQQIRNHLMDVCEIRGMHKGAVGEIQAQVEFHVC